MTDTQSASDKDARIAELEAELAATKDAPVESEKTVKLKHANGTVVHVGESQVEGLKAAGYKK
jgi:hypothetical protein